jgi:hypothetical protein
MVPLDAANSCTCRLDCVSGLVGPLNAVEPARAAVEVHDCLFVSDTAAITACAVLPLLYSRAGPCVVVPVLGSAPAPFG